MRPKITVEEFQRFIEDEIPLVPMLGIRTMEIGSGTAIIRMQFSENVLRPGGTVSGPALMALADVTVYAAVLGMVGRFEHSVTTNLSANFLRKPGPADVVAEGRILKLGKRLAFGECSLRTAEEEDLVAHVTATYSIPPR
jgi:uncharacterized protein (TIGR00369 family)